MSTCRKHFHIQRGLWGKKFKVLAIVNVCMSNVTQEVTKHHLSSRQSVNDLVRSACFNSFCICLWMLYVRSAAHLMKKEEKRKIIPAQSSFFFTTWPCRMSWFSYFLSPSSSSAASFFLCSRNTTRATTHPWTIDRIIWQRSSFSRQQKPAPPSVWQDEERNHTKSRW